ncbi:MAG: hypothetical protein ACFFDI_17100 [Promethearchaeota archaeon]
MSKKKELKITCKACGNPINPKENPPIKTWQLYSPLPDKQGRITITIMGSFRCPNSSCRKSVRAAVYKLKGDPEAQGPTVFQKFKELISSLEPGHQYSISELAEEFGMRPSSIQKALEKYMEKGEVTGQIEDGYLHT